MITLELCLTHAIEASRIFPACALNMPALIDMRFWCEITTQI